MKKWIAWSVGGLLLLVFTVNTINFISGNGPEIGFFTVMALVIGFYLFMTGSDHSFNSAMDGMRRVDGVGHLKIEQFYEELLKLDTPLGKPWLGKIKYMRRTCIIWGPNEGGEYIYSYKTLFTGRLYVAYNNLPEFLRIPEEQQKKLRKERRKQQWTNYRELVCYKLGLYDLVNDLYARCVLVKKGQPLPKLPDYKTGSVYRFDQKFRWLGQDFHLCDIDGNPIYVIKGAIPLKTFRILDARDDTELFRMTKRLAHILPCYDFYQGEEKIGTLHKKLDFLHDRFEMNTARGKLKMRGMNATFGDNFQVYVDNQVIGTIVEKLNLTLVNLTFDNFVIHAYEESDILMLTALAVMAARHQARRRSHDSED